MASIDRTTYPRFKSAPFSDDELDKLFRPTDGELDFVRQRFKSDEGCLALMVLLKCHQYLGRLPAIADVPGQVTQFLRNCLAMPDTTPLRTGTWVVRHRHRIAIHDYLNLRPYSQGGQQAAQAAIRAAANAMSDPADLINAAIDDFYLGPARSPKE